MRPARRRELVDFLRTAYRVSIRRACRVLRAAKSSYHYKSRKDGQAVLRKRIREIAETRVRYGYRRIHLLLQRDDRRPASAPGEVWAMDFMADQLFNGQRIRVLTIVEGQPCHRRALQLQGPRCGRDP